MLFIRLKLGVSLISGLIIFFSSFIYLSDEQYSYIKENHSYLFRLVIPSIALDKVIYDNNSELNNVDYNVEILSESDIGKGVYFFAGHSGYGDNCYFNRVKELDVGDVIYVYYGNKMLIYEVVDKYLIIKSGYMEVDENLVNVLFLITCSDYGRQLIVKAVLIN